MNNTLFQNDPENCKILAANTPHRGAESQKQNFSRPRQRIEETRPKLEKPGTFRNQLNFDFSGITFQDQTLTAHQVTENKMMKKLSKHNHKFSNKILHDMEAIRDIVRDLGEDQTINLISKVFDSPNIVLTYLDEITDLYVGTWAITPAGIDALIKITNNGIIQNCWLILDKTHSYKWIFTSDAYKILKGKVKIKFCTNHSKFICFQTLSQGVFNFVGSMNFSKNPRFENITIDRNRENYEFYKHFLLTVGGETV